MKKNIYYKIRVIAAVCAAILTIAAFGGIFYGVKILDLQFGALLQRIFIDFSITALILTAVILAATFIFGRLYCSVLCPFGILQELISVFKKKNSGMQKNFYFKYIIAAVIFGTLAGGTAYLLRLAEPYTYFGSAFSLSAIGIAAVLIIVCMVIFKDRFFCTNICPVGTVLGLVSKISVNKIYLQKDACTSCEVCANVCPSGCINPKEKSVCNETCVKCLKCLNVCPKNAVKYGAAPKEEIKFSPKRRRLIFAASAAAVFAVSAKAGAVIKKTISRNFSDVILPPGALNEERFANKCLNCNLCVKICPTKIIKKSDGKYGAVSIDYSKGFCDFTCGDCAAACPAGALKKLSLAQKQRTRIAMIAPPAVKCDEAVDACPTQALTKNGEDKPFFSASKCIGCATCKSKSPETNIQIYGVKNQKTL
ncbi:MAG: 4Fe-4S binding protein [Endomicrobium sp.]|jgi:polyferredoxin|nr:4Fe-4S binding protein [Endomicrobium sp.]